MEGMVVTSQESGQPFGLAKSPGGQASSYTHHTTLQNTDFEAGFVRVDNITYIWMGAPTGVDLYVNQTAFEYVRKTQQIPHVQESS